MINVFTKKVFQKILPLSGMVLLLFVFFMQQLTAAATSLPVITAQPASCKVAQGGNAAFTVTATGSPAPTFQWKFNGINISGATSSTLNLDNVLKKNGGNYTVTVPYRTLPTPYIRLFSFSISTI